MNRILLWAAAACLLVGCNSEGSETVPVSGVVMYEGNPVPEGDIIFRASDGRGHSYGGRIREGRFAFDAEPGVKEVEITARRELVGARNKFAASGEAGPVLQQYIPRRYNSESTLQAEVADAGENEFTFELDEG